MLYVKNNNTLVLSFLFPSQKKNILITFNQKPQLKIIFRLPR